MSASNFQRRKGADVRDADFRCGHEINIYGADVREPVLGTDMREIYIQCGRDRNSFVADLTEIVKAADVREIFTART